MRIQARNRIETRSTQAILQTSGNRRPLVNLAFLSHMFARCLPRFKVLKRTRENDGHRDGMIIADADHPALKVKALRGGLAKICGQAGNFALRLGFLVVLARLLSPKDFGLVAMVTAVTGVYGIFTSAGLSAATIQRSTIDIQQISTLFWINIIVGTALGALCIATAPVLVQFYQEPRLFWITIVLASGFILNAAGVQHSAILQRQLRYVAATVIELLAQAAGVAVGIGMALAGFGYWSLVGAAIISPAVNTAGNWIATGWMPCAPKWNAGVSSMLRFGGTITLNSLGAYIAYNFDKLLLGRVWGANVLGIYSQAYQLINVPAANINAAIGSVAFSALSRLHDDLVRLKRFFLKSYSLTNSMTIPVTMFSALFAEDIILVLLGPRWAEAAGIFRLLTPTILIFGIINPLAWLLQSIGLQDRSLRICMVLAPIMIASYAIGLPYGAAGVAFAYSASLTLWLVPHVLWCLHGTVVSPKDLFVATVRPVLAGLASVGLAFTVAHIGQFPSPIIRLLVAGSVMMTAYAGIVLFLMGQMEFYSDLFRTLFVGSPANSGNPSNMRGSNVRPNPSVKSASKPLISVGLAVYNGEKYLSSVLELISSQTFDNFEIVISDNASTDGTSDICMQFSRSDRRFIYHRNTTNIGANNNFNQAFSLGRGKYSIWASHDDVFEHSHFEKCLQVLEADANVVLCQSDTLPIDADGLNLPYDPKLDAYVGNGFTLPPFETYLAEHQNVVHRFADLLKRSNCSYEFGMIRRDVLARTGLMRDFFGSGEVMLIELALQGRFSMVNEKLFRKRFHQSASFFVAELERNRWLNPTMADYAAQRRFRFTRAYLEAIRDARSLSQWERTRCLALVASKSTRGFARRLLEPAATESVARA